jgi:LuxR family transcriptional regulator, quorum-sensing system regulator SdiA
MNQPRFALVSGPAERIETLFKPDDGEDALWEKLEGFAREAYGVTSMMYAFTHSKYTVSRTGIMPSLYLRHNHPPDYLATFTNGLTLDDGVAAGLLLEGQTPLLWADFPSMDLNPRQRRRLAEDQACGMGVGVSFGFRFGANSGVAALCWASRGADAAAFKAMVHARRAEMEKLAAAFDALMRPAMVRSRIHITPREKDVLSYSAGGMSAKQIAEHLALSPKTVTNTLERARHSLGAVSTMEAVAKALVYELIG